MQTPSSTTVLNVDDNPASLYAKSRILRHAGFTVLEAANGEEALRIVDQEAPAGARIDDEERGDEPRALRMLARGLAARLVAADLRQAAILGAAEEDGDLALKAAGDTFAADLDQFQVGGVPGPVAAADCCRVQQQVVVDPHARQGQVLCECPLRQVHSAVEA